VGEFLNWKLNPAVSCASTYFAELKIFEAGLGSALKAIARRAGRIRLGQADLMDPAACSRAGINGLM
jgi:hypothetical protein